MKNLLKLSLDMAAKRRNKRKTKFQGMSFQCVTVNNNRNSDFLRIHHH